MTTSNNQKSLQSSALNRKLTEAEIISLAWSDPLFHQQLEANPKETLAKVGLDVPEGFDVVIEKEPENELRIVLPPCPSFGEESEELEESELSAVAGGSPALIDGKNCRMADIAKKDFKKGGFDGISGGITASFSLAFGSVFGLSWCWN